MRRKANPGIVRVGVASGLGGRLAKLCLQHRVEWPAVEVECKDMFSTLQNEAFE